MFDYYGSAVESLRTITKYKNESLYPESEDQRDFNTLKELMKNCLG